MNLKLKFCSSLAKVMPLTEPEITIRKGCALRGERFSFQLAFSASDCAVKYLEADVESDLPVRKRKVALVPVENPSEVLDDDIISDQPGLYPDLLTDFDGGKYVSAPKGQWRSIWFTVDVPTHCAPGVYPVKISLHNKYILTEPIEKIFEIEVLDAIIPTQKLKNTHWFYTDCLADYYNVPAFSEEHWKIIYNYMKSAVDHGINMILTPVFTPALDTEVGGERTTVQLIDVTLRQGKYKFGFERLERWIKLARQAGIKYYEIPPLFTQWGSEFTPKIIAKVDGKTKRIFGWDVSSSSREYNKFLNAFLPALVTFLKERKLQKKFYFHCSDEPSEKHLETYKKCRSLMEKYLKGFTIMDALSHVEYFKQGIVTTPVPVESKLEEFIEAGMKDRWTYYCCGPSTVYCNRFIVMPSARNRIFGTLLYMYKVTGFLHWGFNFYNSQLSAFRIDPYRSTDSGGYFPAGDPFLVYPGKNGIPEDSIRAEVFYEALQDQRVLNKLEALVGRETVEKAMNKLSPTGQMRMAEYPKGERSVLNVRATINRMLKKALEK
ncbi:MAG: DUF4091 domain-containing protein [Lentisphaeria bacterium]|nr:DUF4091 domain-containing protein [Lentisphaeria bacterium]